MNRWTVALYGGLMLAGLGMGMAEAAKWLHTLSVPGSPAASAFSLIRGHIWLPALFIVLGAAVTGRAVAAALAPSRPGAVLLRAVVMAAAAIGVCWAAIAISTPFHFAPMLYLPVFAVALALAAGLLVHVFTPSVLRSVRTAAVRGAFVAVVWMVFVLFLRLASDDLGHVSFGGFGTFAALASPPEFRIFPTLLRDLACGALYGAFAGVALSWIAGRGREIAGAAWGAAAGAWLSAVLYAAHSVAAAVIMQSAYSERTACFASLVLGPAAGAIAAVGVAAALGGFKRRSHRLAAAAAALLLAAAAGYVVDSRAGSQLYLAARRYQPYRTRVYVHFHREGAWSRTLERNADEDKIALCNLLIRSYPRSIYVPEAMYLKAKSQFSSWQFAEAVRTLEDLRSRYRDSRGISTRLLAHAYLAMGRFRIVAADFGTDEWDFSAWRRGDGAQMIGHAYEVTGQPEDALGLYTYYIRNLEGSRRGAWITPAVQYAEMRTERVMPARRISVGRGAVRGRVLVDARPMAGVHVALVQPHLDASSPDDSRQFTGALTVPLWFGMADTTGADGFFAIRGVPYGEYEVVVGFDAARLPAGRVISRAIPPVQVDRPEIRLADIRFVPSIRPVAPLDGLPTGPEPTLVWRAHPDAAYYSVLIVSRPNLDSSGHLDSAPHGGYTCWMRSGIKGTSVKVTPEGFGAADGSTDEARSHSLVPGRSYMWLILAHDKAGRVISSSEHYRLDREPIFFVRSDDSKGG